MKDKTKSSFIDVSPDTRVRMQAVKRHNTNPEIRVRRLLHSLGYRFRLHCKDLPSRPDIVLPRHRKVILVHGCFWHGHEQCRRAKIPINNAETWRLKMASNRLRDIRNADELCKLGWEVLAVWECEVQDQMRLKKRLLDFLQADSTRLR